MQVHRISVILALAFALVACGPSANEGAIARAMALSTSESALVVKDLRALAAASEAEGQHIYRGNNIPSSIQFLEPIEVVASPGFTRIYLSGAVDDKVYLLLREQSPGRDGHPHGELVLLKGEIGGSTVLWKD